MWEGRWRWGWRRQRRVLVSLKTRLDALEAGLARDHCQELSPCRNGGSCVNTFNSFFCQCPDTWEGATCERDVDECAYHNPCQNHGTCQNTEGGYECICVNGYIGKNCETNKNDCEKEVCLNGGTCHDRVGGYFCECPPGKHFIQLHAKKMYSF